MESASGSQDNIASQPTATGQTQQTHSPEPIPEPIEPAVETEFPLVSRLTQDLEQCSWDQLQEKYADAMDEHSRVEGDLRAETTKLLEAFTTWSQTTVLQDENRALKRFKTQMQHVQNSEESVENKKRHCELYETIFGPRTRELTTILEPDMEVVRAFESALALLNEQGKT